MARTSVITPVIPIKGLPVLAGLMCRHYNCNKLFSDLEDMATHVEEEHGGVMDAISCSVQELHAAVSGEVVLLLVQDKLEDFCKFAICNCKKTVAHLSPGMHRFTRPFAQFDDFKIVSDIAGQFHPSL
jgi:hypothetical protein